MIRIMILDVKKFDIVCLEFKHVCLDLKGIYQHDARGCLKVFNCYTYFLQCSCVVANIDRCILKAFFSSVRS